MVNSQVDMALTTCPKTSCVVQLPKAIHMVHLCVLLISYVQTNGLLCGESGMLKYPRLDKYRCYYCVCKFALDLFNSTTISVSALSIFRIFKFIVKTC